jgi:hypothetical protein
MNNFTPLINELISEPDNVEKIRGRIAGIIKGEAQNQYALAIEAGEAAADDFNFRVFVENARPYDTENEAALVSPIINIMLSKAAPAEGNPRMGPQKTTATFIIDCIAFGNDSGDEWDDKQAACRAWKAARVIRAILMSEQYAYLGLRGIVGSRLITSIETGAPEMDSAALAVVTSRIMLEVQFVERAIGVSGPIIEGIDFEVDPSNGEVIAHNNQED